MKRTTLRFLLAGVPVIAAMILVADEGASVKIQDDCQPKTFNLDPNPVDPTKGGAGPGVCRANFDGETSFANFIHQLMRNRKAEDWKFDDTPDSVSAGTTLRLSNEGGETHTFTRVENFGGGFVIPLNQLSGNPVAAPECLAGSVGGTFVPSQARNQAGPTLATADRGKKIKFQCCIHPWMRTEVRVR
jgi:hypothetical protein